MQFKALFLNPKSTGAVLSTVLILLSCTAISLTSVYRHHSASLSTALILDLTVTAPLLCYLFTRNTTYTRSAVLKVFMLGMLLAGMLVAPAESALLRFLKTWVAPLAETALILFLIIRFRKATKELKAGDETGGDFLCYCRSLLTSLLGSPKAGSIIASEMAVFYYAFVPVRKNSNRSSTVFTSYKESGMRMLLGLILSLLLIETASMHFLFLLWNKTLALVLTTLSLYTCLQLFAHIRSIRLRPSLLINNTLLLRNGIWGGEVNVALDNIDKAISSSRALSGPGIVKLSFLKKMDNHNVVLHLKTPVTVITAFGREKQASTLLLYIDGHTDFLSRLME